MIKRLLGGITCQVGAYDKVRVRENVTFIQESLDFFDEIISIFANGGRVERSYRPAGNGQKRPSTLIYHRKV